MRFVILAAVVASVSAGNLVQDAQCVVQGEYKKATKEWSLTLGSCDDAVDLKFKKQGGYLKTTDDEFCVRPSNTDSKDVGSLIVLGSCNGRKWTLVDGWFWQSKYNNLCIGYDETEDALVQVDCTDAGEFELDGCDVTPVADFSPATTSTSVAPAAPTVTSTYTCANYVNSCPQGYSVPSNYYGLTCSSAYCVSSCCMVSPPSWQTCGSWALQNGGAYGGACGKYGELTPYFQQPCQGDRNCAYVCCNDQRPSEQTCASWAAHSGGVYGSPCGFGGELIDDLSTTCSFNNKNCHQVCCTAGPLPPQSCSEWNNCADGTQLKDNADSLTCSDKSCQATCCEDTPVVTQTCSSWGYNCPQDFEQIPSTDDVECADDDACVQSCCQQAQTTSTCGDWSGSCTAANTTLADAGTVCDPCDETSCCISST